MREGWEYKKLGEVCKTSSGGTPSKNKSEYYLDGDIPWLRSGEVKQGDIYNAEISITKLGLENSSAKIFPVNTVVIAMYGATVGQVGILRKSMCTNQAICGIFPTPTISCDFLRYVLLANQSKYLHQAIGGAQANISQQIIKNTLIPNVDLETQKGVVAELDQINDLIRLKKEQLKEYDNLAQSIFYDMFGDPVENEKGWEVKPLGEFGFLGRGVSKHRPRNAPELLGGSMPLVQTGDVANSGMYLTKYNSTYSDLGVAQSKIWEKGTLCITIAATIGKCAILSFRACFPDSVVGFLCNEEVCNNVYMYFIFSCLQKILEEEAPAVAQKNINLKKLNSLMIPLPPLPLQQEFSSRIEQIENLKTEVQKTITDLETLLASRMQYWFE